MPLSILKFVLKLVTTSRSKMLNEIVSEPSKNSSSDVAELRSQARLGTMPIVPGALQLVRICGIALGTIQMFTRAMRRLGA
jgi:hypothetical protein